MKSEAPAGAALGEASHAREKGSTAKKEGMLAATSGRGSRKHLEKSLPREKGTGVGKAEGVIGVTKKLQKGFEELQRKIQ